MSRTRFLATDDQTDSNRRVALVAGYGVRFSHAPAAACAHSHADPQLIYGKGYDHYFVLRRGPDR